jgi:hypothetical protein
MFGPINIKSLGGDAYFVTFIDDASKKVLDFLIKEKDQGFRLFRNFIWFLKGKLANY